MAPDVEVDVLKLGQINAKNAPLAMAEIAMTYPETVRIGEPGYTTVLTLSEEGAAEIQAVIPEAVILPTNE